MALDQAITALTLLKPFAKLIPVVGDPLEGAIEALKEACKFAKDVRTNKEDSRDLAERAALCMAAVVREMQRVKPDQLAKRTGDIEELLRVAQVAKQSSERRSQQRGIWRTWNKDADKDEIQRLGAQLNHVIERFGVTAHLRAANKLEAIEDIVKGLEARQISSEERELLDRLHPIQNARHDSQTAAPACLANTRVGILDQIMEWALDESSTQCVFWLAGLAGTGKTTIVQTLSECLADRGVLGTSFFISRADNARRDPQNILRSLVYQLSRHSPDFRRHICSVLRNFPDVVDQALSYQFPRLLSEPLAAIKVSLTGTIVLVIDALDECEKDKLTGYEGGDFLPRLLIALQSGQPHLKLVITSRTERTIKAMFNAASPHSVQLHEVDRNVVQSDIRLYLEQSFRGIALRAGLSPDDWPTTETLEELVRRAQGLFVYAAAVAKFVGDSHFLPKRRLEDICNHGPSGTSSGEHREVDAVYLQVLRGAVQHDDSVSEASLASRLCEVINALVAVQQPLSIAELAALLATDVECLHLDLTLISAVVIVPEKDVLDPVTIFHPSFADFLLDSSRCTDTRFRVDAEEAHGHLALWCLRHSLMEHQNLSESYSTEYLGYHLRRAPLSAYRKCIEFSRETLQKRPKGHSMRDDVLWHLALTLQLRYERAGNVELLTEAGDLLREGLILRPPGHPKHGSTLQSLGVVLELQYKVLGDESRMAEMIYIFRALLVLHPHGHRNRSSSLQHLADAMGTWFMQTGNAGDIIEAIDLHRAALELRPPGHPDRSASLRSLANALLRQFDQTRNPEDLVEATDLHRTALELRPPGHPDRSVSLTNLASALLIQFKQTGNPEDLSEGTDLYRAALELQPPGHPYRSISLGNLAYTIQTQFEQTGRPEDLSEAADLYRAALELQPPGHPRRSASLNNLANALRRQFEQTGKPKYLNEAIDLHRAALELQPPGHPDRSLSLYSLANALRTLLQQGVSDLHRAALKLLPPGHPGRSSSLNNLANALLTQFEQTGKPKDLSEAIDLYRAVLELEPPGYPYRNISLRNLANALRLQLKLGRTDSLEAEIAQLEESQQSIII